MTEPFINLEYPLSNVTAKIIKIAKRVYQAIGPGFEELIYQRALELECKYESLDFSREIWIEIHYRDTVVGRKRVDFIIMEVMVEIKAKASLEDVDYIQTLSYLKASKFPVGLLLNFGGKQLEIKRFINEKKRLDIG
jgi:GxxExxY protein